MTRQLVSTPLFVAVLAMLFIGTFGVTTTIAQSQALNGQIEGFISDANGAGVPNASVVVRSIDTGAERTVSTDASGFYRVPLLPLGGYRVTVEASSFKRTVREGITLSAGQTASINISLEPGDVSATVTITSDAPIADSAKIDVGRTLTTREIQDLPLVSRNPYNYSLLQANVVGRPNTEFGVPRVSANGFARRTNFQLDGNVNTQANQAGLRLVPISETFISEVQLVTNGFSAEFGNTPGLVMNNITPSGTNDIKGSASYRFRRTWMSSRAFNSNPTAVKPPTDVNNYTFAVGGPIIKDRWHFYGGYEDVVRDFSGRPQQLVTITEANKTALIAAGLPSSIFASSIPASQKVKFLIARTDAQLNKDHRLTGRFIRFQNFSPNNIGGGLNTLERTVNLDDKSNSFALQLASILTPNVINEFRYQRAHRNSTFLPTEFTPSGVSVVITNVANFGPATNLGNISPIQTMNQFQNNLTWTRGNHQMKFGGGINHIYDFRRNSTSVQYTFPNLTAYVNARNGTAPFGYTSFAQSLGDPEITYRSKFYNFFAQDDWRAGQRLKISYGVRYDLYDIPEGLADAAITQGRRFNVDKNNIAPRLGMVYALSQSKRPSVFRASVGVYYDTVYLAKYESALQSNGSGKYVSVTRTPSQVGAPGFPNAITAGFATLGITQNIETINPDFRNMYAIHTQLQFEQAISENYSVTVGYINSNGRQMAVYKQINCLPTGTLLADGRPIYGTFNPAGAGTMTGCTSKINTAFNNIIEVSSGAQAKYNAMTVQLNKRFSQGYQFSFNYTLSKARDNAPERYLQGVGAATQSDPSNLNFDWAYGVADQRHTVSSSFVARPQFNFESKMLGYIINNNQIGFTAFAGSGETFPIVTNFDLNGDGVGNDIPVGLERNAGRAPGFFNVDFRYSRIVPLTERFKLEFFGEATNIFNINSTLTYGAGTTLTTGFNRQTGVLTTPINYANFTRTAQESRQGQFGVKFVF
jgi:hypothetical protein